MHVQAKKVDSVPTEVSLPSFTVTPPHSLDKENFTSLPSHPPRSLSLGGPTSSSKSSKPYHQHRGSVPNSGDAPRRLSRKLPPALTESLLALERFETVTSASVSEDHSSTTGSGSGSDMSHFDIRRDSEQSCSCSSVQTLTPSNGGGHWNPGADFAKYTLVVEPPSAEMGYPAQIYSAPPLPPKSKRVVARHQIKVEPRIVDASRSPSLDFASLSVDELALAPPLSPSATRMVSPSPSLFMSNWPSRRPQTPATEQVSPPSLTNASTVSTSSWSALQEFEAAERADRLKPKTKETRKEKKIRQKAEKANFDAETPPGLRDLFNASLCEVIDENGEKTQFGDLVTGKRTIVIFIRHWFCPLCAQYMNSILAEVPPSALEEADVDLIIIGNGSHKMLNGYKNKSFKCPFKMYTDPSLQLYRALGLTRQTGNAGPDSEAGSYLVQTPLEATMQTIKRATQMPLLHSPGHFTQIGGEFVFDGSLNVIYTHRMTTTRDHSPIEDVCAAAGMRLEYIHYEPGPMPPPVHRASFEGGQDWVAERNEQLEEIRKRKERRRGGTVTPPEEVY